MGFLRFSQMIAFQKASENHSECTQRLCSSPTIRAVDAGVLVVAEEEAVCALTLVAPHGVDAHLLAPAVVVCALVNICEDCRRTERERDKVNPGTR